MGLLGRLPEILEKGKIAYLEARDECRPSSFVLTESFLRRNVLASGDGEKAENEPSGGDNILARGDNLSFMNFLATAKRLEGKIDLIYIDPPFFSRSDYGAEIKLTGYNKTTIPAIRQKAYADTWDDGIEGYLSMLIPRLFFMKDLLSEEGSIFVHLDWHAAHYVKVILDEIFGEKNFINEIIWHYKSGGVSKRTFARKHDTMLLYAKSKNYYFSPMQEKSYNRAFKPYRFKGVKEYRDELGWYTMVNRKDVWMLDMVGRTSAERTGYVTQKPEALIERILESCTKEGGLCADFFGGSGTMAAVADRMGRRWISCDIGKLATIHSHKRLMQQGAVYDLYEENSEGIATKIESEPAAKEAGRIQAQVSLISTGLSDTKKLRIELLNYELHEDASIPVGKEDLPMIRKALQEDPLSLVAYWSVDCHYRAPVLRPVAFFCKERNSIEAVYETIGKEFGPVGIKVVDIFGNSTILEITEFEDIQRG